MFTHTQGYNAQIYRIFQIHWELLMTKSPFISILPRIKIKSYKKNIQQRPTTKKAWSVCEKKLVFKQIIAYKKKEIEDVESSGDKHKYLTERYFGRV